MWSPIVVVREVWLTLVANGWRTLLVLVAATGLIYVVATTESLQAQDALDTDAAQIASGKYTYRVTAVPRDDADTTAGLAAARCASLAYRNHVVAVGGFTMGDSVTIARAPGLRSELVTVVGRMTALWDPSLQNSPERSTPLWVSETVARQIGLVPGSALVVGNRTFNGLELFNPEARFPQASAWIAEAIPPHGRVSECWVEFSPGTDESGPNALRAWFADGSQGVAVTPVLVGSEFSRTPAADFMQRPNRYAWLPAGIALGLVLSVAGWFKRAEIALYRTLGSGRLQTSALFTAQGGIIYFGSWALATALVAAQTVDSLSDFGADTFVLGARAGFLTAAVAVALQSPVFTLLAGGATAYQIKDRG